MSRLYPASNKANGRENERELENVDIVSQNETSPKWPFLLLLKYDKMLIHAKWSIRLDVL